jgi:cytochrome P450 family 135
MPLERDGMTLADMPGPNAPRLAQAVWWASAQHRFFNDNLTRYGSPFRMRVPFMYGGTVAVFGTTSAAQQLLRMPAEVAHGGEAYAILRQSSGPTSVIVRDEDEHLRLRKLMLPALHGERLQQWRDFVTQLTLDEIATWPIGRPFPLRPVAERITMSVITKIVFGVRDPGRARELHSLLPVLFQIPPLAAPGYVTPLGRIDLGPLSPWGRFRRKRDRIDELIRAEIADRRGELAAGDDRGVILSALLSARDEDGRPMSGQELRDQLVTMLVAGHETTSTALAWALERLLRTPDVLKRLVASVDAGETAYLDAVIKESLRIRPVVAQIGRVLTEDCEMDGWRIPARTMVVIPMSAIHLDPSVFPEPKEFRPERFLDGDDPSNFAWLPFGGGVKRCPGASLALLEMRAVLTAMLGTVELAPDRSQPERPRVRGITVVPHRGGRIVVTGRRA